MSEAVQIKSRGPLNSEQIALRKRFIGATFVTCVVLALLGGTIHVLMAGNTRMNQMREKVRYDIEDLDSRLRSAGEDMYRTDAHEHSKSDQLTYTLTQAEGLLPVNDWKRLNEMVTIPAGEFIMGTDSLKSDSYNRPQHKVFVKDFQIDKYPVTNAQYAVFVASARHRPPIFWANGKIPEGKELHPVTMISWQDAVDYAAWAGKRLPTEAEWEKAARGTDGRRWPWGNEMDPKRLNTYYNVGKTTPVGSYPEGASPFGVLDMAGNVQQWVQDDFLPYQNSSASSEVFKAKVAVMPDSSEMLDKKIADFVESSVNYKVMRGGSWKSDPFSTSTYHRNYSMPNFTSDFFGFRCVKDVKASGVKAKGGQSIETKG